MDDRANRSHRRWTKRALTKTTTMFHDTYTQERLSALDKRVRTALINTCGGIRTAFVGISGSDGVWNAGTFSNVTHVGAHPAQISVLFRPDNGARHTYTNYKSTGRLTLVVLPFSEHEQVHNASVNAPEGVFEWAHIGGSAQELEGWSHPIPQEALWAIELSFVEEFTLGNGCIYTVGAIEKIGFGAHASVLLDGTVDFQSSPALALGLQTYLEAGNRQARPYPSASALGF